MAFAAALTVKLGQAARLINDGEWQKASKSRAYKERGQDGAAYVTRTRDLRITNAMLYQLS